MSDLNHYRMYIDGKWCEAEDGASFQSFNPATGEAWATVPSASAGDVDRAVQAAHRAFEQGAWPAMSATDRGRLLRRLADTIVGHSEVLARTETLDTGKLYKETRFQAGFISTVYEFFGGLADKIHGETLSLDKPDQWGMTVREPIGVVAGIVPWNSQLFLVANKIAPALAAGNTVVLKASEFASAALLEFMSIIDEVGFPHGVVNVVTGFGDPCGKALTTHPLVGRISFTGGPQTARHIVRNSAENLAEVSLELGGKSPVIVLDDADIDDALNGVVAGIFAASGQSCVAGSRLVVHEKLCDRMLEGLAAQAGKVRIGDPLDEGTQMGPLATQAQLDNIEAIVGESLDQGARVTCGARRPPSLDRGWYYEPTVLDCPGSDVRSVRDELFGPVLSVLKFRDEEEAVRLANDTRYGLAAGIFTRDVGRALRFARAARVGVVWVNTYRAVSPLIPYGGFKESGYGREGGLQAVYDYTRIKSVWINTSTTPLSNPFVMR